MGTISHFLHTTLGHQLKSFRGLYRTQKCIFGILGPKNLSAHSVFLFLAILIKKITYYCIIRHNNEPKLCPYPPKCEIVQLITQGEFKMYTTVTSCDFLSLFHAILIKKIMYFCVISPHFGLFLPHYLRFLRL